MAIEQTGMKILPQQAAKAYTRTMDIPSVTDANPGSQNAPSFSDFIEKSLMSSIDTLRSGEKMGAKAVTGEADIVDVVQAVTAAEQTLKTVVNLRDSLVAAYKELLQMPI